MLGNSYVFNVSFIKLPIFSCNENVSLVCGAGFVRLAQVKIVFLEYPPTLISPLINPRILKDSKYWCE